MKRKIPLTIFFTSLVLMLAVFTSTTLASEANDVTQVSTYDEFSTAFTDTKSGDVIQLTNDITTGALLIEDKSITIDLNGYTLHIFTNFDQMTALEVRQNGELLLTGDGELNITSVYGTGVRLRANGKAMATNIVSGGYAGVNADGHSTMFVYGNIEGTGSAGVVASNNASATVHGNVSGESTGIIIFGDASVYIAGNVSSKDTGISTMDGAAAITVHGDVYGRRQGLSAGTDATVVINGDVTTSEGTTVVSVTGAFVTVRGSVTGRGSTGVSAREGGVVDIYGNITAARDGVIGYGNSTAITVGGSIFAERMSGIQVDNGATARVYGDVYARFYAVETSYGGVVYIGGNANATVIAWGGHNIVTISGDIVASGEGVTAIDDTVLTVRANAIRGRFGVMDSDGVTIIIYGDVYGESAGVFALHDSKIHVNGNVTGGTIGITSLGAEVIVRGNVLGGQHGISVDGGGATVTIYGGIVNMPYGVCISYAATTQTFATRTQAEYDTRYNGYYIFHLGEDILRLQPSTVEETMIAIEGVHLFLNSYEIIITSDSSVLHVMDVRPIIHNSHTLIPVYYVALIFNAQTTWNSNTREVTITRGNDTIIFAIGELTLGMDIPAQIINGRTFVPLRFISEFFGADVNWISSTRRIDITLNEYTQNHQPNWSENPTSWVSPTYQPLTHKGR